MEDSDLLGRDFAEYVVSDVLFGLQGLIVQVTPGATYFRAQSSDLDCTTMKSWKLARC